jgi:hypothetical protein
MPCPYVLIHQLGASLWKRMRIGFTLSFSQPCSGHSRRCGKRIAPGTGLGTSFALHFGQFKRAPCAAAGLGARLGCDTQVCARPECSMRAFWRTARY